MENVINLISSWMNRHHLKMNQSKTEFLLLCNKNIAKVITPPLLKVGSHNVLPKKSARNIGVTFDSTLSMEQHITNICRSAYHQLYKISKIKKFLDRPSLERIIHAFVTTRLDYCNGLLIGVNKNLIATLQRVQNSAARLLTGHRIREHITPVLRNLHWLPVEQHICFKVNVLAFKCLHGLAPPYLCELIRPCTPSRDLRTSQQVLLKVPFTASDKVKSCTFSYVAPTLFNNLPLSIRQSPSLDIFKAKLKTHCFIQ